MDKMNIKTISLVFSACMIIFSLVFAFLVCWPKYSELKSLQTDIRVKQDELNWQREYLKNLIQIKAEFKNYETEFAKIDTALPSDNSVPSFLNFFQAAASQSGLILTRVSPSGIAPSLAVPTVNETQLDAALDGPYPAFKNFLSILEKSSRFIDVENISFSSPKQKEIFTFNVKIKFYSY
ncbi:MAG: type 4a pilus biogenesis protein PilO [bacterium]|nr:type 4a pilus biogenesis protein PilO [bacterium]